MPARGIRRQHMRNLALGAAGAALSVFAPEGAWAQTGQEVTDRPVLQPRGGPPAALLGAAPGPASREFLLNLNIEYVSGTIFNPSTGRNDKVKLRSYTRDGE